MSILPLTGYITIGLSYYEIDISITDIAYTKEDGEDKQSIVEERTIKAAVDQGRSKSLEYIFGGNVSDGDIGIYTTEELYIDDMYDTEDSGVVRYQSFITSGGINYRVSNISNWQEQTGTYAYLCKRHIAQDII